MYTPERMYVLNRSEKQNIDCMKTKAEDEIYQSSVIIINEIIKQTGVIKGNEHNTRLSSLLFRE